ncbi:MAG: hypothetical protein FWB90_02840 [Fibromonadales bacterium]|nr:hypothetical protein [Fibromonadales bacterium]
MLVVKKAKPAIYKLNEVTLKFRQSSEAEDARLRFFIDHCNIYDNDNDLIVDWHLNQNTYYAAWLLMDTSGVIDDDGNALNVRKNDLRGKVAIIKALKEADPKFSPWFESHIEPAEKKIAEVAAPGELVGAETVQPVQGQ